MAQPGPAPSTDGQHTREPSLAPIEPVVSPSTPTPSTSAAPPTDDATPPGETGDSADADSVEDTLVVADAAAPPLPEMEQWLNFTVKWSGKTYDVRVSTSDLVFDLRTQLESLTSVPPDAQKILGLGRGKLSSDADGSRIGTLAGVRDGAKLTMVGTPEHLRFKYDGPPPEAEWDFAYPSARPTNLVTPTALPPALDPRNLRRVEQIVKTREITVMNDPRPGKRLLVLDLDYTIADTRPLLDGALPPLECARPGLHEFLDRVYPHYDIVVWSQTHWMWLESKLVELGVLGGAASYKICFVADRTSMFPIFSQRGGQMVKHEVKPLAYFWANFPQWSAKNTVHIDDLARNFALNAGSGLKIRAFKGAGTPNGLRDRELDKLGNYLVDITAVDDFTTLDHSRWKKRRTARADAEGGGGSVGGAGSSDPPDGSGSTGDGGSARAEASGGGDGGGGAM